MKPYLETPPKLSISFTETCNLRCRHCYADCRASCENELRTDEWLEFLDYLSARNFIQVYIEGGEPLHRPDALEIFARAARDMMTLLRTNGTLIDAAMAMELRRVGVGRTFVDVMGATAATHDWFTQTEGSFERSCAAVERLRAAAIPCDLLVILTRRNAHEINDILALAKRLGAERVGVLRLYPLGRAKAIWSEIALSLEEQSAVIRALAPPEGVSVMQSWHPFDRNCCWQAATVNARGDSIGCNYLREYVNFGNIRRQDFIEIWRTNPHYRDLRAGQVDQSCPDCSRSQGTNGGCRAAAYAFHGDWRAPDPYCETLNNGVDLRVLPKRLLRQGA